MDVWHDAMTSVTWVRYTEHGSFPGSRTPAALFTRRVCVCDASMCDMTHRHMWHDWLINGTWLIPLERNTTRAIFEVTVCMWHMDVWHDALTYVTLLIDTRDMTHSQRVPHYPRYFRGDCVYVTVCMWLCVFDSWVYDKSHRYTWHGALIYVTWLIPREWNTNRAFWMASVFVWLVDMLHGALIFVTWLIDVCDMTHWYVCHVLFAESGTLAVLFTRRVCVCVCATLGYVTWRIDIYDMTHWYVWYD